jgi:hypothetical protein
VLTAGCRLATVLVRHALPMLRRCDGVLLLALHGMLANLLRWTPREAAHEAAWVQCCTAFAR